MSTTLQARRPPTGASPGTYSSPANDHGVRKPMLARRPGTAPDNLRLRSMSADLERAEAYDACESYPASPSEQQVSILTPCSFESAINTRQWGKESKQADTAA